MELKLNRWARPFAAVAFVAFACSGCVIKADLSSTPSNVMPGESVTFTVKATNPLQCPVGGVVGFLIPFVPADNFINQINDPNLRDEVRDAVDNFCTGGSTAPIQFNGDVDCKNVAGDLVCEVLMDQAHDGEAVGFATAGGDPLGCQTIGNKLICRIPQALVDQGNEAVAQSETGSATTTALPFTCNATNGIAICATLAMNPGEMKMDSISLRADQTGRLRNFLVIVATRRGGICRSGILPNIPCSTDSQCGGMTPDCGSGICDGGRTGFGCDADGDCTTSGICNLNIHRCLSGMIGAPCTSNANCSGTGTCVQCKPADGDNEVLPGLACTTTNVSQVRAPASSPWGLAICAIALITAGAMIVARRRYSR